MGHFVMAQWVRRCQGERSSPRDNPPRRWKSFFLRLTERSAQERASLWRFQRTLLGDESMEAIVLLGIGVEDAAVGRVRTVLGEVRTRGDVRGFLGGGQGAAPFETQAVGAEAPALHGQAGRADGDTFFEPQGTGIGQVGLVAFVEGYNKGHMPALSSQAKEPQGIEVVRLPEIP